MKKRFFSLHAPLFLALTCLPLLLVSCNKSSSSPGAGPTPTPPTPIVNYAPKSLAINDALVTTTTDLNNNAVASYIITSSKGITRTTVGGTVTGTFVYQQLNNLVGSLSVVYNNDTKENLNLRFETTELANTKEGSFTSRLEDTTTGIITTTEGGFIYTPAPVANP